MKQILYILVFLLALPAFSQMPYREAQTGRCYVWVQRYVPVNESYNRYGQIVITKELRNVKRYVNCDGSRIVQRQNNAYVNYQNIQPQRQYVPQQRYVQQRDTSTRDALIIFGSFALLDNIFDNGNYSRAGTWGNYYLLSGLVGGNPFYCGVPINSNLVASPQWASVNFGGGIPRGTQYFFDWNFTNPLNWNRVQYDPRLFYDVNSGRYFRN